MRKNAREREVYRKPELRCIELAAEEVLASGCKLIGGGVAFGISPCPANNCSDDGS